MGSGLLSGSPPGLVADFGFDRSVGADYVLRFNFIPQMRVRPMKVKSSLKSLKNRHKDCRVVRRRGRLYVINKTQRRFKARQG